MPRCALPIFTEYSSGSRIRCQADSDGRMRLDRRNAANRLNRHHSVNAEAKPRPGRIRRCARSRIDLTRLRGTNLRACTRHLARRTRPARSAARMMIRVTVPPEDCGRGQ